MEVLPAGRVRAVVRGGHIGRRRGRRVRLPGLREPPGTRPRGAACAGERHRCDAEGQTPRSGGAGLPPAFTHPTRRASRNLGHVSA